MMISESALFQRLNNSSDFQRDLLQVQHSWLFSREIPRRNNSPFTIDCYQYNRGSEIREIVEVSGLSYVDPQLTIATVVDKNGNGVKLDNMRFLTHDPKTYRLDGAEIHLYTCVHYHPDDLDPRLGKISSVTDQASIRRLRAESNGDFLVQARYNLTPEAYDILVRSNRLADAKKQIVNYINWQELVDAYMSGSITGQAIAANPLHPLYESY